MTQHARKSLLAGTSWKTESDNRRAASLAEAEQNREQAMTDLVVTIDDMSEAIAERHPKPVEALSAEAAFLSQLREMLVTSGDRITAFFANGYQQAGADQAQVHELSSRNQELEQELRAVQGNQDDLERSAQRASDLQIALSESQREVSRLQHQLQTTTQERDELIASASSPNPHTQRIQELENQLRQANSDKDAAVESANAWQTQAESLQRQLNGANTRITELTQEKDRAIDAAEHWHGIAVSLGYTEPDSSDQPDDSQTGSQPAPEEPDQGDEPQTRLIDPVNGAFNGDQSAEQSADESRGRRSWRPQRRSRHRDRSSNPNPDQNDH